MKTIEQRADEYIGHSFDIKEPLTATRSRVAFIDGAKSEHVLLTEWHSPNDIPDTDRYVLIKINDTPEYEVGYYDVWNDSWYIPTFYGAHEFIGWREIYE